MRVFKKKVPFSLFGYTLVILPFFSLVLFFLFSIEMWYAFLKFSTPKLTILTKYRLS